MLLVLLLLLLLGVRHGIRLLGCLNAALLWGALRKKQQQLLLPLLLFQRLGCFTYPSLGCC